jgi:diguanylate cyclase (GGDEF)-like protein
MASILLYVGLYHYLLYLKLKKAGEHLPFSLVCFGVVLYDLFSIGLYTAHSIEGGIIWQRLQLDSVNLLSFAMVWFVLRYAKPEKIKTVKYFGFWYSGIFIASFFLGPEYTLSIYSPSIKNINVFGGLMTYYEGKPGLLYLIEMVSSVITYAYILYLLIAFYRKKRNKNTIIIIVSQIVYFAGVINDSLVASGLYSFVYLSEYAFLFIALAMAQTLHDEFICMHKKIEDMNYALEEKVKIRTAEIEKLNEELKHLADVDGLTGVFNRRFFNEYFEIEIRRTQNSITYKNKIEKIENDMNFGLSIIDIDNFKRINDEYGHLEGDRVLVEVVNEIKKNLFTRDIVFRYGGEEFVVLFTRTSKAGVQIVNEKLRKCIESKTFYFTENKIAEKITVSIGAVIFADEPGKSNMELLRIADERLLIAKKSGKNTIVYTDSMQDPAIEMKVL